MFLQQLSNTNFFFLGGKTTKKISTHKNRLINDGKTLSLMQNQRQRGLQNMLNSYGSPTSKLDVPPTKWNEVPFDSPIWNQSCAHIKSWLKCPRKFYFGSNSHAPSINKLLPRLEIAKAARDFLAMLPWNFISRTKFVRCTKNQVNPF